MANLSAPLRHVKAHLQQFVPDLVILQICSQLGHVWRNRRLDPVATVHLFLLQLLANVAMSGLRHVAAVSVSAQAICKAKQRLPLKLLMELVARSVANAMQSSQPLWKGLRLYLVDGTTFMTPDTPQLARRFGKARNQRGTSRGFPMPKLLALMDFGGLIYKVIALPCHRQEFTCLSRLFKVIGPHGLLLGDRGLVSFAHLALLMRAGVAGCFRLPRGQVVYGRGRSSRRRIKRLGRQDLLVRWTASCRPAWLSTQRWLPLAGEALELRQIAYRIYRKGFRRQWAWIVTTLVDPQQYPAQDLIDLYSQRWQVEVCFRDLKQTLGLAMTSARSVAGVRKEMLCFVLLYNIVRQIMRQAAQQQCVPPDRISFIDALRWLRWASPGDPLPKLKVNPRRLRRSPPRKLKNARHRFPQLNDTRDVLSKPPCHVAL